MCSHDIAFFLVVAVETVEIDPSLGLFDKADKILLTPFIIFVPVENEPMAV